jgi:hypothetical protein
VVSPAAGRRAGDPRPSASRRGRRRAELTVRFSILHDERPTLRAQRPKACRLGPPRHTAPMPACRRSAT